MDNTDYDKTIQDLNEKVSQISGPSAEAPSNGGKSKLDMLKSPYMACVAVPIVVLVGLFFIKPGFIMETKSKDGEMPRKVVNFKKLLLVTLVICGVIGLGVYLYFFKTKKPEVS